MEGHREAARSASSARSIPAGISLVAWGIALNAFLAVVKIAGGILGSTYALIADGVESLLDIFASAIVWAGLRVAVLPADEDHPYGHGKAEPLAGLGVAVLVFIAALWIGVHAVREIVRPHHAPHWATLPLLAGVVVVKFIFSRQLLRVERATGSTSLGIEAWHHLADALTSLAAFIGIAIAIAGGPGYESADDWAALVACVVVACNGAALARRALDDVMDVAVPRALDEQIRACAAAVQGVRGIDKCRVRKSGLNYFVDIHVEVEGALSVRDGHAIAGAVKHALLGSAHRVNDVLVHIEPARG